jgi:hypothetical protein
MYESLALGIIYIAKYAEVLRGNWEVTYTLPSHAQPVRWQQLLQLFLGPTVCGFYTFLLSSVY